MGTLFGALRHGMAPLPLLRRSGMHPVPDLNFPNRIVVPPSRAAVRDIQIVHPSNAISMRRQAGEFTDVSQRPRLKVFAMAATVHKQLR